ncbi:MAG: flavoprotein [Candidatus Caenarcaniphilales bacterium]|nr:flavoprotein [Candidatus Caenarcaniphilales bacterium]
MQKPTITLAITGASGSIYGMHALKFLLENDYRVDLVLSDTARQATSPFALLHHRETAA